MTDKPVQSGQPKEEKLKKQQDFLVALELNHGHIGNTCKAANLGRSTYYDWLSDEKFKAKVEELQESLLDTSEDALRKRIEKGDTRAILFHLTTKGKKRGWIENPSIQIDNKIETLKNPEAVAITLDRLDKFYAAQKADDK